MEIEATNAGEQFPIPSRTDAELLKFSLQLAAPCSHCSIKAQIALLSAKMLCEEEYAESSDARFTDPRWILCGAVTALEGLNEAEAELLSEKPAPSPSHLN